MATTPTKTSVKAESSKAEVKPPITTANTKPLTNHLIEGKLPKFTEHKPHQAYYQK